MHSIISNHVFQDGNKRTGLEAAKLFARLNGYDFRPALESVDIEGEALPAGALTRNQHLIDFTLAVAAGKVPLEVCQRWFAANLTPVGA